VLALEIMIPNPAIRNLIREDKVHQIYSQMQVGQEKFNMQTLNQSLFSLFQRRLISQEEAMSRSLEPDELRMMMEGRTTAMHVPGTRR
jgi:twitching motility protein PilT